MADGAKPDVPTTDRQNEKKKKRRPFYEAVDAHARRRLINVNSEKMVFLVIQCPSTRQSLSYGRAGGGGGGGRRFPFKWRQDSLVGRLALQAGQRLSTVQNNKSGLLIICK